MTLEEIKQRVAAIAAVASPDYDGDRYKYDGEAHQLRDALLLDVLEAISRDTPESPYLPSELARAALAVREIGMALWFE